MKNKLTADRIVYLAAPAAVTFILLLIYAKNGFYPFGIGTVSWCDMDQQVLPLLLTFKNIVRSGGSLLYSFQMGGGMNFWGVFFFFLASPLHLLVLIVPDARLMEFMNILTLLKMALCALTMCLYLKKHHHRPVICLILSVLYAFSGYQMMFFQNTIWMDCAVIFPLLVLSFEELAAHKKARFYILMISLQMILCYYIGYMVIILTILYFSVLAITLDKEKRDGIFPRFITASLIAAGITAIIWIPSLLQFFSSGRETSIVETLENKNFFSHLPTTFPFLFPSAFALVAVFYGILHEPVKKGLTKNYLLLLFLLLVPVFIEPINTMWHTGSYMSFPVRYGFMLVFFLMSLAAHYLENLSFVPVINDRVSRILVFFILLLVVFLGGYLTRKYISAQLPMLVNYTHHLWGNTSSVAGLSLIALLEAFLSLLLIRAVLKGWLKPAAFGILSMLLICFSVWNNSDVYMTSADSEDHVEKYQESVDLAAFKPSADQSLPFYRMKMKQKYFHANTLGSLGYASLGHYTSLTSQSYMFAMKNLGYSSYWMEVGGYGGTHLTDAYFSIGYQVEWADGMSARYANDTYKITQNPFYLPLGVISSSSNDGTNGLESKTRFENQQLLWSKLFPESEIGLTLYEPSMLSDCLLYTNEKGLYQLRLDHSGSESFILYSIDITDPTTLYFDCFDELSNHLSEHIYKSFRIYVDDENVMNLYPTSLNNGLIDLGTFENQHVEIRVELLQAVSCRSFGVLGLNLSLLEEAVSSCHTLNLTMSSARSLSGYSTDDEPGGTVFLSLPYDSGLTLRIDGKKAPLLESFDGFCAFVLPSGHHEITISYLPPGFVLGAVLSLVFLILFVLFLLLPKLHEFYLGCCGRKVVSQISMLLVLLAGIVVFVMIYVFPMIIFILEKLDVAELI
ncbi:MAG: YfhO family protein [Firmicutes bacterium]|nr:YfhO family protein [Bacillota bacterium]